MIFEPLDFIARLAALVPKPRVHLPRVHGVFAPNRKHRAMVTSDAIAKKNKSTAIGSSLEGEERRATMSWAMRWTECSTLISPSADIVSFQ